MNKLWDGCLCLGLDKRKEYWQPLIDNFKKVNVDVEIFACGDGKDETIKYDQIDIVNPDCSNWGYGVRHLMHHHYNALLGHKGMVRKAIDNNWKSLLFLEDDCYPIVSRFEHVLNNVKTPNDWDILYLSWWKGQEDDEFNLSIEEGYKNGKMEWLEVVGNTIGGFHSVVVRNSVYPFILNCPMVNPIDGQLGINRHHFKSYILTPKITTVGSIYSFTEGSVIQRKVFE